MLLFQIFQNNAILILPWLAALLVAITVHEFAHGFAAYKLGDDTAMRQGRLSLNPLAHLDPVGSLMLLLAGFGWAKPVPVDIYKVGKGNLGKFIVSVAGVFFNIAVAALCLLALKLFLLDFFPADNLLIRFFAFVVYINIALFV